MRFSFLFFLKPRLFIPGCDSSSGFQDIIGTIKQKPRRIDKGSSSISAQRPRWRRGGARRRVSGRWAPPQEGGTCAWSARLRTISWEPNPTRQTVLLIGTLAPARRERWRWKRFIKAAARLGSETHRMCSGDAGRREVDVVPQEPLITRPLRRGLVL